METLGIVALVAAVYFWARHRRERRPVEGTPQAPHKHRVASIVGEFVLIVVGVVFAGIAAVVGFILAALFGPLVGIVAFLVALVGLWSNVADAALDAELRARTYQLQARQLDELRRAELRRRPRRR